MRTKYYGVSLLISLLSISLLAAEKPVDISAVVSKTEAEKILAIGKSTAEAYELAVKALGGENFTRYKITEELAKGKVKLIPDLLIGAFRAIRGLSYSRRSALTVSTAVARRTAT